ncbi:hypothetical protein ACFE04_030882 [Oxalis oulophora]
MDENSQSDFRRVSEILTDNAVKNRFSTLQKKRVKYEALAMENYNSLINSNKKRVRETASGHSASWKNQQNTYLLESLDYCNDPMLVANEAAEYITCPMDGTSTSRDEIVEELKKMERQNSITHFLLSAVILLNIVWQLSEVSLILKIKHALTNPFKWVGNIIAEKLAGRPSKNGNSSLKQLLSPSLQVPHVELPLLSSNDG